MYYDVMLTSRKWINKENPAKKWSNSIECQGYSLILRDTRMIPIAFRTLNKRYNLEIISVKINKKQ